MRLRLTFGKAGPLKYCSHLELARVWERALRRAGISLVHSQGYNPRPKMQLASPLPLGHAACAELLDIWTENEIDPDRVLARVSSVLPDGLTLHHVAVAPEDEPALQARLLAAEYEVHVEWEEADAVILDRIKSTLARETIRWERRGKVRDLRPLIERLDLRSTDQDWVILDMRLSAREAATGRPEAVLDALGMGGAFARYTRRRLFID